MPGRALLVPPRNHVGDQAAPVDADCHVPHPRYLLQHPGDTLGLHPETAHLQLGVTPAQQLQPAAFIEPAEITGAVHPLPSVDRAGHETGSGQLGIPRVPLRQPGARDAHLTDLTCRNRLTLPSDHEDRRPWQGVPTVTGSPGRSTAAVHHTAASVGP